MADTTYILGILFATVATFLIWLGYKILVPIWNFTINPLANAYPSLVNNNPVYLNAFYTMASEINILFQYSFIIMMLGVVAVYVVVYAYRRQFTSSFEGEDDY